jgi:Gelsolin repeat
VSLCRSLNTGDAFVLDAGLTLYVWAGPAANSVEKGKAVQTASDIKVYAAIYFAILESTHAIHTVYMYSYSNQVLCEWVYRAPPSTAWRRAGLCRPPATSRYVLQFTSPYILYIHIPSTV